MPAPVTASLKVIVSVVAPAVSVPPLSDGVTPVMSGTAGEMVVVSLAVSLEVFVSPPPETVAVVVTLPEALEATFTVSVRAGVAGAAGERIAAGGRQRERDPRSSRCRSSAVAVSPWAA